MSLVDKAPVWDAVKRLTLGVGLIALLSAILLLSDLGHRTGSSGIVAGSAVEAAASGKVVKAAIVYFALDEGTELCIKGLVDGLKASGFDQGSNLEVRRVDSQGEMINIPAILQNYDSSDVDLIMTITTPCLAGACSKVKHKNVVFTCVTDPIAAGAGTTRKDHLPFLTGVGSFPPVANMLALIQKMAPDVTAVGTMFNPAEANSVKEMSFAREVFRGRGIRLEEVAIASSNEVLQAVQILAGRNVQAIWVPGDNTVFEGYEGAVKGARDAHLPLFSDECPFLERGGTACLGVSAYDAGVASGKLAGRVLHGERPQDLPIQELAVVNMGIRRAEATRLGLTIPPEYASSVRP